MTAFTDRRRECYAGRPNYKLGARAPRATDIEFYGSVFHQEQTVQ
jgi:hypothetical protein